MEYNLKLFIQNSERRLVDYKRWLEEANKDKVSFPPTDESVIAYKEMLRECKNDEEKYLKKLVEEKTFENQGLNPPYCYRKF